MIIKGTFLALFRCAFFCCVSFDLTSVHLSSNEIVLRINQGMDAIGYRLLREYVGCLPFYLSLCKLKAVSAGQPQRLDYFIE